MSTFSTFLFARPSFAEGCARILDVGGTLQEYNRSATEQEADFRAMFADWHSVGVDLQAAINAAFSQVSQQVSPSVQKLQKAEQKKNRGPNLPSAPSPASVSPSQVQPSSFISVGASFSGPIPPPAFLQQYNEIIPGGANRILEMAEKQADHRRSLESAVINSDIRRSKYGLFSGLAVVLVAIITGGIVAFNGQPWAGATIAAAPSAALVGVFIYGTAIRSAERVEKSKIVTGQPTQKT